MSLNVVVCHVSNMMKNEGAQVFSNKLLRPRANFIQSLTNSSRIFIMQWIIECNQIMLISVSFIARLSCCLYKSIAYAARKVQYICTESAVRGLHFSHTNRAISIERDLTIQCDNIVNEIWSNDCDTFYISSKFDVSYYYCIITVKYKL